MTFEELIIIQKVYLDLIIIYFMDYLSIIGLSLDFVGILILFLYVDHFTVGAVLIDNKTKRKVKLRSKIAFGLVLLGFLFQILAQLI